MDINDLVKMMPNRGNIEPVNPYNFLSDEDIQFHCIIVGTFTINNEEYKIVERQTTKTISVGKVSSHPLDGCPGLELLFEEQRTSKRLIPDY
jgi:hypothetical protein